MRWTVILQDDFHDELGLLAEQVQDEMLAHANLLAQFGPHLGRPTVDTLKASRHPNMKELRLDCAGGVWRVAFAFDPKRQAILLVFGDKVGKDQRRFYKKLIAIADARYDGHLALLQKKESTHGKKT
jgi:hypothetical protein